MTAQDFMVFQGVPLEFGNLWHNWVMMKNAILVHGKPGKDEYYSRYCFY